MSWQVLPSFSPGEGDGKPEAVTDVAVPAVVNPDVGSTFRPSAGPGRLLCRRDASALAAARRRALAALGALGGAGRDLLLVSGEQSFDL